MSDGAETQTARRPPGRPRSERSHQAIVVATLELLAEQGFQQLTMEQVARRAGVGKATIYRRWAAKADLVKDAIRYFSAELPVPDTGTLAGDYAQLAQAVIAVARSRNAALLMPPGDRDAAVTALEQIASQPDTRELLIRRGHARAQSHTTESECLRLADFLAGSSPG